VPEHQRTRFADQKDRARDDHESARDFACARPGPHQSIGVGGTSQVDRVDVLVGCQPRRYLGGASGECRVQQRVELRAVTGGVRNSGLVEIPMGTPLRAIVEGAGGGSGNGKPIKAIQTGGPSGGMIPAQHFDTPVSYEHLISLGTFMGSGGMIVMTDNDCMVDIAKFYLGFCVDESCGKCAPCRIGGFQMLRILEKIADGRGEKSDIDTLRRLATAMQKASLCGLGQGAPNPVLSTLQYFMEEFEEHVVQKKCRAGKCTGLLEFVIKPDKCKRCRLCVVSCPVKAVSGSRETGFDIDQKTCIKCGKCFEVCKFDAVARR